MASRWPRRSGCTQVEPLWLTRPPTWRDGRLTGTSPAWSTAAKPLAYQSRPVRSRSTKLDHVEHPLGAAADAAADAGH